MEGEDENPVDAPADTDADTDTDTETPETQVEPEVEEKPAGEPENEYLTLDEFLTNRPEALQRAIDTVDPKDLDAEDLKEIEKSPALLRVLATLLKRADAAAPELDEHARTLAARESELKAKERLFAERQRSALKWGKHQHAVDLLAKLKPQGDEPEKFTEEWFEWKLDQKAEQRFASFFDTISKIDQEQETAAAEAIAAEELAAKHAAEDAYAEANKDTLSDPKLFERVRVLYNDHNFGLEEAHQIALREAALEDVETAKKQALELSRSRIARGGRKGPTLPATPDLDEDPDFYKRNPEAVRRDFRREFGRDPLPGEV